MTRAKSRKKQSKKKEDKHKLLSGSNFESNKMQKSWVDQIKWIDIDANHETKQNNSSGDIDNGSGISLSLICWNVLAHGYCSRNSHPGLPRPYQEVSFDRQRRGSLIRKILCSSNGSSEDFTSSFSSSSSSLHLLPDVWALQEVDMDEILNKHLSAVGYAGVETPRMKIGSGAGGKVDSCGIYYQKVKWNLLDQELVRLDDLASMPPQDDDDHNAVDTINNNLQGLQRSFLRRNCALMVRLQHKSSPNVTVVLAASHLFWNPTYDYVKLCQMHYILIRAKMFLSSDDEPFVICGDFNSLPGNSVHTYLSKGDVNARLVAPWYREGAVEAAEETPEHLLNRVSEKMSTLNFSNYTGETGQVRYLLDFNLNRLCRWLRILGLDVGLETEDEERLRTKEGNIKIFERCQQERRVLVTTSSSLLSRKDCPAGTYLINPKTLSSNWEIALCHILLSHGVVLDPAKFLTRCVICNGNIVTVEDPDLKKKIFKDHQAPADSMDDDLAVYQCDGCHQGYWFCDSLTSSATRVKGQATRLYQMCLRAEVPIAASDRHMFEHVDVAEERKKGWDWTMKGSGLLKLKLQVTEWLKNDKLACPIPKLESAYRDDNSESGESIPFTNVTSCFEGLLDYIFFNPKSLTLVKRLYVPTTYEELNSLNIVNGHLLPSNIWPSDHLAVGATFILNGKANASKVSVDSKLSNEQEDSIPMFMTCAPVTTGGAREKTNQLPPGLMQFAPPAPNSHGQRCSCGCVPDVLSLFEMAELRKQAKLKKETEK